MHAGYGTRHSQRSQAGIIYLYSCIRVTHFIDTKNTPHPAHTSFTTSPLTKPHFSRMTNTHTSLPPRTPFETKWGVYAHRLQYPALHYPAPRTTLKTLHKTIESINDPPSSTYIPLPIMNTTSTRPASTTPPFNVHPLLRTQ
jgi:hypothetical protein